MKKKNPFCLTVTVIGLNSRPAFSKLATAFEAIKLTIASSTLTEP